MHEQYFNMECSNLFYPSLLFKLKLKLFGKKIVEVHGGIEAVWYAYKGKLYMTKYSSMR